MLSCPLVYRYGRPELKVIFSEEGKLERLLAVEASLARAHASVGNIPHAAAAEISQKATTRTVDVERVHEIEAEIRHDLMAVVKALTEKVSPDAGKFIHLGATSYDVIDCANALMIRDGLKEIDAGLAALEGALARLAREHRDTIMLARTHGQAALPMTFGLKLSVFLLETRRHRDRLRESLPRVVVGKMAGAVGTAAGLGPHAVAIADFVARDLAIGMEDGATQIVQRDRYNELFQVLANVAASLEKFATEIRNLQRTEIAEVAEGFDRARQVGSSTMAQKRNPVKCEKICGLARVVRSAVTPAYEDSIQWHERDLANSSAERFLLPHSFLLTDEIAWDMADVFEHLDVYADRMRANLDRAPEVMAESVMLKLVEKGIGRQDAHELVRKASLATAQIASDDGAKRAKAFADSLRASPEIGKRFTAKELDRALDPAAYTGHAGAFVDRALAKTGYEKV
ncbi:MAG: adenylosuccinate lyase [Thermoplasmatota archaeon]